MADITLPIIDWKTLILEKFPPFPVGWHALNGIIPTHTGTTQMFYSEKTTVSTGAVVDHEEMDRIMDLFLRSQVASTASLSRPLMNEQDVVEASSCTTLTAVATTANKLLRNAIYYSDDITEDSLSLRRAFLVLLNVFRYQITLRAQPMVKPGSSYYYLDHIIALEPIAEITEDGCAKIPEKPSRKVPRFDNAENFLKKITDLAMRLLTEERKAFEKGILDAAYDHKLAVSVVQHMSALPYFSLVIQEEKCPATLDLDEWRYAWKHINKSSNGNPGLKNMRIIDAQIRAYSFSINCPWVVTTEQNTFVLVRVYNTGVSVNKTGALFCDRKRRLKGVIRIHSENMSPRAALLYPIIQQLLDSKVIIA